MRTGCFNSIKENKGGSLLSSHNLSSIGAFESFASLNYHQPTNRLIARNLIMIFTSTRANMLVRTFLCFFWSGPNRPWVVSALRDNRGNDFIVSFLRNDIRAEDFNFLLYGYVEPPTVELHITTDSISSVPISVEYPVGTFLRSVDAVTSNITIVSLPAEASTAWNTTSLVNANSVRVYSTAKKEEFVVYMVNRADATSDAALALPLDALNTKYIVLDYDYVPAGDSMAESVVTAVFDGTNVTIKPTTPLESPGGSQIGVPFSVALNRGESYYAVGSRNDGIGLSGTVIEATYPVTVTNGIRCANIPIGIGACDHIFEVAQPVQSWGTSFAAAPLSQRDSGIPYRIIASQDYTSVNITSGGYEKNVNLSFGEIYDTPELIEAVFIQSNKPAFVVQFMTGQNSEGAVDGDPAMGNVVSTEQYLSEYTFATVGDNQFGIHYLSIIANNADVGTISLDGAPIAVETFTAIGGSPWSWAAIPLAQGTHTTRSLASSHGITVEGYDNFDSYIYPGGAQFDFINKDGDTNPPVCMTVESTGNSVRGRATDNRASEDVNGNGILDDGEDLNGNGLIDEDTGIFSVTLVNGSNLKEIQVDPFKPGEKSVDFLVERTDEKNNAMGSVVVDDGAGNKCTLKVALVALVRELETPPPTLIINPPAPAPTPIINPLPLCGDDDDDDDDWHSGKDSFRGKKGGKNSGGKKSGNNVFARRPISMPRQKSSLAKYLHRFN